MRAAGRLSKIRLECEGGNGETIGTAWEETKSGAWWCARSGFYGNSPRGD